MRIVNNYFFMTILLVSVLFVGCTTTGGNEIKDEQQVEESEMQEQQKVETETEDEMEIDTTPSHRKEQQTINIISDESMTVLVNKMNGLSENYEPKDLVSVEVPTVLDNPEVNQLRKEAADALYDMFEAAKREGIYLYARSGYRSYRTQVQLFQGYAAKHGEEAANRYSAKPGHSEHQTGLVMDVTSESVNLQLEQAFGETKEGQWVREHAHEFGFIIRYPEGKEDVTGYMYEPWHLRYLGVDVATKVIESGLTYEEFLVEEGIIHEVYADKTEK